MDAIDHRHPDIDEILENVKNNMNVNDIIFNHQITLDQLNELLLKNSMEPFIEEKTGGLSLKDLVGYEEPTCSYLPESKKELYEFLGRDTTNIGAAEIQETPYEDFTSFIARDKNEDETEIDHSDTIKLFYIAAMRIDSDIASLYHGRFDGIAENKLRELVTNSGHPLEDYFTDEELMNLDFTISKYYKTGASESRIRDVLYNDILEETFEDVDKFAPLDELSKVLTGGCL